MSDYRPVTGAPPVLDYVPPEDTPVYPDAPPVLDYVPPEDTPVYPDAPPVDVCEYVDTLILDCPII